MFFKKKKPKRLYYPTASKWYTRPRKRKVLPSRRFITLGLRDRFSRFLKDAFLYVVVGGVFLFLFGFLFFSKRFSINTIEVAREDLFIDSSAIVNLLADYKGTSMFTFSKLEAQTRIEKNFPEFSSITIRKLLPDRIKIELETHPIVANVRAFYLSPDLNAIPEEGSDEDVLEADENVPDDQAVSDEEAEATSDSVEVTFDELISSDTLSKESFTPVEQKALVNSIGQAIFDREENLELMTLTIEGLKRPIKDREFIISTKEMQYIQDTIKYFTNLVKIEIEEVTYYKIAREVHLTTVDGLTLWLVIDKPYKEQLDKFNAIYKKAELDKEDLVYIDLRPADKVLYCPRGEACDR